MIAPPVAPGFQVLAPDLVLTFGHRPAPCPDALRQRIAAAREAAQAHAAQSADLIKRAGLSA